METMANVIWKFPLPLPAAILAGGFTLSLPAEWTPLCTALQRGAPCLWVQVEREAPRQDRFFRWVPTGGEVPDRTRYLGTVLILEAGLGYHLYLSEG